MSKPGWYADPGGQPGMFRYWDGQSWSTEVTANPLAASAGVEQGGSGPASDAEGGSQPAPPSNPTASYNPYAPMHVRPGPQQPGTGYFRPGVTSQPTRRRSRAWAWWILLLAAVLAFALAIIWALRQLGVTGLGSSASNPTSSLCPSTSISNAAPSPHPDDGRVYGGKLSYPELGDPWEPPSQEYRVPFGRDQKTQIIMVQDNYDGKGDSWVASVLVAELVAGDGFYSPKDGMDIVAQCIVGTFYGNAAVTRTDNVAKNTTVDGHPAYLLEMHLAFNIKGLDTKGELAILEIVQTGTDEDSIFYASIPDTVSQYVPDAREAMAQLKVSS